MSVMLVTMVIIARKPVPSHVLLMVYAHTVLTAQESACLAIPNILEIRASCAMRNIITVLSASILAPTYVLNEVNALMDLLAMDRARTVLVITEVISVIIAPLVSMVRLAKMSALSLANCLVTVIAD